VPAEPQHSSHSAGSTSLSPGTRPRSLRGAAGMGVQDEPNELAQRISAVAEFFRKRITGDYTVDEFGFDPQFNNAVVMPLLRFFFDNWFRVEVSGDSDMEKIRRARQVVAMHYGRGTMPDGSGPPPAEAARTRRALDPRR